MMLSHAGVMHAIIPSMSDLAEKRRAALRRYMEQHGLKPSSWAKAAGLSVNALNNFLNGSTQSLSQGTLEKLSAERGEPISAIIGDPVVGTGGFMVAAKAEVERRPAPASAPMAQQPRAEGLVGDKDLPVYASAQGGSGMMLISYEPIEWVKRPEPLFGVPKGFAVYVVGDSMIPAYEQGDNILVHPTKPPLPGDDVLVVLGAIEDGMHEAMVKRLVRMDSRRLKLRQWNPPPGEEQEFDVDRVDVVGVHLIVGKYNKRR
ncbi:LexA family transcriptional regulator [Azospirillum canadense]|uniref:LexA family transcriptional regulator n=1 Tax=Azospirillum canadense TaxID=403962 RepID=UPI002226ADB7|nr:LexA family transcriptional regulator [Azospirillum canadense]MCW2243602.1 phage repressor protein C with HTH and peptisase S24 domain [Azospirillum canadense]